MHYKEQGVMNNGACAREEREAGARSIEEHHCEEKAEDSATAAKGQFLCRGRTEPRV